MIIHCVSRHVEKRKKIEFEYEVSKKDMMALEFIYILA